MTHADHIEILRRHAHASLDQSVEALARFYSDADASSASASSTAYLDAMGRLDKARHALAFLLARGGIDAIVNEEIRAEVEQILAAERCDGSVAEEPSKAA